MTVFFMQNNGTVSVTPTPTPSPTLPQTITISAPTNGATISSPTTVVDNNSTSLCSGTSWFDRLYVDGVDVVDCSFSACVFNPANFSGGTHGIVIHAVTPNPGGVECATSQTVNVTVPASTATPTPTTAPTPTPTPIPAPQFLASTTCTNGAGGSSISCTTPAVSAGSTLLADIVTHCPAAGFPARIMAPNGWMLERIDVSGCSTTADTEQAVFFRNSDAADFNPSRNYTWNFSQESCTGTSCATLQPRSPLSAQS